MTRATLRMVLLHAAAVGAEEGRLDAASRARRPLVRRTVVPVDPRAAAMARALREADVYGFGGES